MYAMVIRRLTEGFLQDCFNTVKEIYWVEALMNQPADQITAIRNILLIFRVKNLPNFLSSVEDPTTLDQAERARRFGNYSGLIYLVLETVPTNAF